MTMSPADQRGARGWHSHSHAVPMIAGGALAIGAIVAVAYLLWPTWGAVPLKGPERLPVSVGGTLFNVPTASVRMKIQRHTGPQERVDLAYDYPSLTPPEAPHHVSPEEIASHAEEAQQPIDRIFVSIAAHRDAMAPEQRLRTIYPRYLGNEALAVQDGLAMKSFRAGTPYDGEDLFTGDTLAARCTRDGKTPGMCLSERRVEGADLIFRFPRSWLSQWREVAEAIEKLTLSLHGGR